MKKRTCHTIYETLRDSETLVKIGSESWKHWEAMQNQYQMATMLDLDREQECHHWDEVHDSHEVQRELTQREQIFNRWSKITKKKIENSQKE